MERSFSCRIVDIDYYTAQPIKDLDVCYSSFRSSPSEKVPVVRIFGATPGGQKTCLHVHSIFPYLYVPCRVTDPSDRYLLQLAVSIDQALQLSLGASSKQAQHVFKITVVEGIPFYGYHASEELFLKIYLYNPGLVKRLADLLVAGAVMNDILQPHEAHIPFILQFMMDYNLYGMNQISLSAVKFRLGEGLSTMQPRTSRSDSVPSSSSSPHASLSQTIWSVNALPNNLVLALPRLSTCELEVDCVAQDIVNRHEGSLVAGGYPGLAALWEEERSRRQSHNQHTPVTPPPSPGRAETSVLQWEEWQWEELNHALKERFDSVSPEHGEATAGLVSHTLSQSCQVELHEPTSLIEGVSPIVEESAGDQSICDEEAIRRSMELTQRLSPRAIRQSTDEDLLALLEDLAAGSASPCSSQTVPLPPYESSVQRLATQLRRSVSSASASQSNGTGPGPVPRAESVSQGPRSGPRSSPESGASVVALGSDEELFLSSSRGETPPPSLEAEPKQGTPGVAVTAPVSCLGPHGVDGSELEGEGADATYNMSEISFMQFEGTQLQGDNVVRLSQGRSGAISMVTPTRQSSRTSIGSGVEVVGLTPRSQRKYLLRLCSEEEEEEEEGEGLEDPVLTEKEGNRMSEEEEEEESFFMSQPVWDDIDPVSVPPIAEGASGRAPKSKVLEGSSLWQSRGEGGRMPHLGTKGKKFPDTITQLDGTGDLPSHKDNSQDKGNKLSLRRRHTDTELTSPRVRVREKPKRNLSSPSTHQDQEAQGPFLSAPSSLQPQKAPGSFLLSLSTHQPQEVQEPVSSIPSLKKRKLSPIAEDSHSRHVELPSPSQPGQGAELPAPIPLRGPLHDALVAKALTSSPRVMIRRLSQREVGRCLARAGRSPSESISELGSVDLFSDRSLSVGPLECPNKSPARVGHAPHWEETMGSNDLKERGEICGEKKRRRGGRGRSRGRRGTKVGARSGRKVKPEEIEGVEEVEVLKDEEEHVSQQVGPSGESFFSLARPLDVKCEGSSPPPGTTLLILPLEGALNMEAEARDPSTIGVGDSNQIAERSPGNRHKSRTFGFEVEENTSHGSLVGVSDSVDGNTLTCAGVPVCSTDNALHYVAPVVTPMVTTDDRKDLMGGETNAVNHQSDEPDLISSDNDFHLTYASTSEGDSESCGQEEGDGGPPSPCEGPETVRRTSVTLMSHSVGDVTLMSHCTGDVVMASHPVDSPPSALSHIPNQGEASCGMGTCEPISDVREIPSPEVKSKYGLGGLDREVQGLASRSDRVGAYKYACLPPSVEDLMSMAKELGLPRAVHVKPFCGKPDDVQPAREVGGRLLKIRSHMPYDLRDFEPAYLSNNGVRFSSTGLSHWRLILAMVSNTTGDIVLPPPCHKMEGEGVWGLGTFYSADDHKRDIELRSQFFGDKIVAVMPTRLPPSGREVTEWCKQRLLEMKEEEKEAEVARGGEGGLHSDQVGEDKMEGCGYRVEEEEVVCGREMKEEEEDGEHAVDQKGSYVAYDERDKGFVDDTSGLSCTTSAMLSSDRVPEQGFFSLPMEATPTAMSPVTKQHDDTRLGQGTRDQVVSNGCCPFSPHKEEGCSGEERSEGCGGESEQTVMASETDQSIEEEVRAKIGVEQGAMDVASGAHKPTRLKRERPKLLYTTGVKRDASLLEGPSPENSFGFKMSESVLGTSADNSEVQHLTTMSIEVHVQTRGKLRPDPSLDPVLAIFYYVHNDWPLPDNSVNVQHGVLAVDLNNYPLKTIPKASPLKNRSVTNQNGSPAKGSPVKGTPIKASPAKMSPAKGKSPTTDMVSMLNGASSSTDPGCRSGQYLDYCGISEQLKVAYAISELDLFQKLTELVRSSDPDLLVGFEVEALSWGYLTDRAATLNINLSNELSRVPSSTWKNGGGGGGVDAPVKPDRKRGKAGLTLRVPGRILLNIWRTMRHELALNSYTFESLAFHVLHVRVPHYPFHTLTSWYSQPVTISRVVDYYSLRCMGNFQLLEKLNVIGRTSEFARLYGIEFESVLSRGSQYRVESMLLRLAKPSNFIAISPSVQQRARMAAPECLQLILEPESRFYADPVLVLDFQSLYPSMMIAYNYCYSTCLGRVRHLAHHEEFTFGASTLRVPSSTLKKLKDHVTISPNGVMFVKPHVRKGVVPRMVEEILNTRIMVKQSMKLYKDNKSLLRIMDARQLGLKMIINVTYGYTGATYSGRMPCVEISDSIVRKGRETLERAIHLVNTTPEWRAKVVYGDTDSMFVLLKGASKEEAFRIGKEIGDRVTALNPKPVKLKFEKVYMPCILQTKKRYVGFAYESLDQKEPTFDAKGIETVRRDGCPAVAKILGKSLRLLFSSRDVSLVRSYVQSQCGKLLEGRASVQDYTLAREYRGKDNYRPGACVPALELTKQSLVRDPCSEPRVKERVPYVVVYGSPGLPLIQLIKRPEDILEDASLRLNGVYYITKLILPALNRAFSLLGVDVWQWYAGMPRVFRAEMQQNSKKNTIGQYFATMHCVSCGELTMETMCVKCREEPQVSTVRLCAKMSAAEKDYHFISELCHNCVSDRSPDHSSACTSLDCPILYLKNRADRKRTMACSNAAVLYDTFPAHLLEF